jgi:penicillin-binding protein 2
MFGEHDIIKNYKGRAELIGNIVLVSFAIILARLWFLQIYKGDILRKFSIENRLRKENVKAPRGIVFSRNNEQLIYNSPRFDAVVTPQYLINKKETLGKLSQILNISLKRIQKILSKNSSQARYLPILIKKNLSRQEVAIIETENAKLPGVAVSSVISRDYNYKEIGAHVVGYISEINKRQLPRLKKKLNYDYKLGDSIGQAGLEEQEELNLRGKDGYHYVEVDAKGRIRSYMPSDGLFQGIKNRPSVPGNNIRLTIDKDLQLSAYNALEGKVGSAVAVDIRTGEVLAMVSRPSFDPSQFSRGISSNYWSSLVKNERNPLRHRAIQEHYAPGSTFKTITAIAALEEGLVDESTKVICKGSFRLGRSVFHCWKKYGHGNVDIYKAIRESCDVYFYKIAIKLDIDILAKYASLFGLGKKLGINLPRETKGLIPTKEWKKKITGEEWQLGETLSCVIGQSFVLSTPLQLAMTYASIANGGRLFKPYLIKEIFSNDGKIIKKNKPKIIRDTKISSKTLNIIKKGLYQVVNKRKGTAWWHRGRGIQMSGKTGTSQVIRIGSDKIYSKCEDYEYKYRHHGIFVAYAPTINPKIAVSVVVEHGCHGSSAAAPVAKEVITTYLQKYYPEIRKRNIEKEKVALLKLKKKLEEEKAKKNLKELVKISG